MSIEKVREEFEAAEHARAAEAGRTWEPHAFKRSSSTGDYLNPLIAHGWWAWQASRESLIIELPSPDDQCDDGATGAIYQCAEAIEAAGLKVKS